VTTDGELAPAKVNLCLHVTGRRADGYHLLDSLVTFAEVGDVVRIAPGEGLRVAGPFADVLGSGEDNLCLRAVRLLGARVAVTLEKNLPVAAGLGGGSADAAAVLRLLSREGFALPGSGPLSALGADVPVCLGGRPARMRGIGEELVPAPLPRAWLVLVNPGATLPTGAVFARLARRDNEPVGAIPPLGDAVALARFLARQRNDLEPAAVAMAPPVREVLEALASLRGCLLARMSGSGATCFGLFATGAAAQAAAGTLERARPGWWIRATGLRGSGEAGTPAAQNVVGGHQVEMRTPPVLGDGDLIV